MGRRQAFPKADAVSPDCRGETVQPKGVDIDIVIVSIVRPTTPGPCARAEGPSACRPAGDRPRRMGETGGVGPLYPDILR